MQIAIRWASTPLNAQLYRSYTTKRLKVNIIYICYTDNTVIYVYKGFIMLIHEGVRSFQKYMTKYINGDDVVIIEDAKTHHEKGVFMPFKLYALFQEQINEAIREDIKNSFVEDFDGVSVTNEH